MSLLSRLFVLLYWSRRHRLFGLSIATWFVLLPLMLAIAGLAQNWPLPLFFVLSALSLLVLLLFFVAGRLGYKRFQPDLDMALDDEFAAPRNEHRVPLRATGVFSVRDREAYVLEQPAEYWRVPLGQHVFMVQEFPGRFLYQIINPEHVEEVQPGYLLFGSRPQQALALHFHVTWGPQLAYEPTYQYVGEQEEPPPAGEARTIYLTFDSDADLHAVWKSLLLERSAL